MTRGRYLAPALSLANQEKGGLGGAMKSRPKAKAAWAKIARPELILIDFTSLIYIDSSYLRFSVFNC